MKLILNMNIGPRLGMAFGVVLLLMLVSTGVGINRMSFIQAQLDQIVEGDAAKLRLVNSMRDLVRYQSVTIRDVVMQEDLSFKRKEMKLMREATKTYRANATQLEKLLLDPQGKSALAKLVEADGKVKAAMDEAVEQSLGENHVGAGEIVRDKVRPAQIEMIANLDSLLSHVETLSKNTAMEATQAYQGARWLVLLLAGFALVLGVLAAYAVTRSITRPLNEAVAVANAVAAGDLSSKIEVDSSNETGRLLQALKHMNENLRGLVNKVRSSADSIATGTAEIASGNLDLSSRTEEQASSLEETAASMEELTSTVKQNAENAKQANQLAISASAVAVKGGAVVSQVVNTMSSINDSSKKIADIIGVIDGIAFQTNILALNAAVEAARAGEQGRGFAVVASEVRNLAQRSAAAAKEIKALIGDSVEKVGTGTKLVDEAGKTMAEIVTSVKRVTDIMSEIAAASSEQSAGIEQVNQAITQMDDVTQQNAALVEEAAAAAESLQDQAGQLVQAVSVFKLDHDGQGGADSALAEEVQDHHGVDRRGPIRAPNVARIGSSRRAVDDGATARPRFGHR